MDMFNSVVVIKLPYLKSTTLCIRLSKGIGHNYYGEPAWPNDILYILPIIIGLTALILGFCVQPYNRSEDANPFATPIEILPECFATFNLLRHRK